MADQFLLVPIVSRGADVDCLYNLNRVGTFIWERLDGRTRGADIVEALVERFEVEREQAEEDYRGFVLSAGGHRRHRRRCRRRDRTLHEQPPGPVRAPL